MYEKWRSFASVSYDVHDDELAKNPKWFTAAVMARTNMDPGAYIKDIIKKVHYSLE